MEQLKSIQKIPLCLTPLYPMPLVLLPDFECLEQCAVLFKIGVLQVIQKMFSFAYEIKKRALSSGIFLEALKMAGKMIDAVCE